MEPAPLQAQCVLLTAESPFRLPRTLFERGSQVPSLASDSMCSLYSGGHPSRLQLPSAGFKGVYCYAQRDFRGKILVDEIPQMTTVRTCYVFLWPVMVWDARFTDRWIPQRVEHCVHCRNKGSHLVTMNGSISQMSKTKA